jgi:uncharacterized SAM-dependent methyltransferase
MHLVSLRTQSVRVAGVTVAFDRGEVIVTEHCYKHSPAAMAGMLAGAGWRTRRIVADPRRRMHLWLATTG